jgi:hypothetical protein
MMKTISTFAFFFSALCFSLISPAQEAIRCATDQYIERQLQNDPEYLSRIMQAQEDAKAWSAANPADSRNTYVIPVVVHVVYKTVTQNISEEQIQSQIDVLNEDYNRTNADASKTPEGFLSVAGSIPVKFCLAAYDPEGNETNGIVRVETDVDKFYLGDSMKHSNQGGSDAWPTSKYLNIWVCNLGNNVLGYATLPTSGNPSNEDGVVIRYNVFGRTGVLSPSYNRGRTTTHEVGHWLGLFHNFEGGCSDNDGCDDTPAEKEPVFGCPAFPQITCNNGPDGDMYMNYMDYTNDVCMNLFTLCQCEKMESVLTNPQQRLSIQSSPGGCQGVAFNLDASISLVTAPMDTVLQQGFNGQVQLSNRGAGEITTVQISYQVDGQSPETYQYNGSLTSLQSVLVDLPVYFTGEGGHVFYAWTSLPNNAQDEFVFNDTASSEFLVKSEVPKNTHITLTNIDGYQAAFEILNPSAATMYLQLVNAVGQVVLSGNVELINSSTFAIDVSHYSPGLYFLYGKIGFDFVKEKIMVIR